MTQTGEQKLGAKLEADIIYRAMEIVEKEIDSMDFGFPWYGDVSNSNWLKEAEVDIGYKLPPGGLNPVFPSVVAQALSKYKGREPGNTVPALKGLKDWVTGLIVATVKWALEEANRGNPVILGADRLDSQIYEKLLYRPDLPVTDLKNIYRGRDTDMEYGRRNCRYFEVQYMEPARPGKNKIRTVSLEQICEELKINPFHEEGYCFSDSEREILRERLEKMKPFWVCTGEDGALTAE